MTIRKEGGKWGADSFEMSSNEWADFSVDVTIKDFKYNYNFTSTEWQPLFTQFNTNCSLHELVHGGQLQI